MRPGPTDSAPVARSGISVFLVSCAIIILQLALMRTLSLTRWHHFSYFVISTALLGFGISGTFLHYAGARLLKKYESSATALCFAFAITSAVCLPVGEQLPLNFQYLLYSKSQIALFIAYNLIVLVPFFLGATLIGLALMHHKKNVPLIYGCSMLGTAIGGIIAVGLMFVLAEDTIVYIAALFGLASGAVRLNTPFGVRHGVAVTASIIVLAILIFHPPLSIDQYKTISRLHQLERQGSAENILTRHSPRGRIDVFSSQSLHYTLFAGLNATTPAPAQSAILRDGELAGTIYEINSPDDAPILDHTPASFPYRLMEKPSVLLLGETGTVNIWLAKRFGASRITVVQPDPVLVKLVKKPLSKISGGIFTDPEITVVIDEPRAFLEKCNERFDIIQIVTVEGLAAGTSGLQSLNEDFLMTVEGIALAWQRLTPRGVIAVTRGIQTPPRDSLKIFATFTAALESRDIPDPETHLALLRNYLAATILAFRNPMPDEFTEPALRAIDELSLDVEWLPGFQPGRFRIHSTIAGPEGGMESYIGNGARKILGSDAEIFFDEWMYNIRPARDDSPYFFNFFRWESIELMRRTYGPHWFRRLELGYMILVLVLIEAVIIGAILIILPLFRLRAKGRIKNRLPTFLYFLFIGLGFMLLEMTSILRFTRHLGDPIYSTSLMIACYLLSAGAGSILSARLIPNPRKGITSAVVAIIILGAVHILATDPLMSLVVNLPAAGKALIAVILTLPLGFFMGWMFPLGLRIVSINAGPLVPWAWAINGFASVIAPPLALMFSMSLGFQSVLAIALVCYTAAGIASRLFPR
jgi:hypothetical protein